MFFLILQKIFEYFAHFSTGKGTPESFEHSNGNQIAGNVNTSNLDGNNSKLRSWHSYHGERCNPKFFEEVENEEESSTDELQIESSRIFEQEPEKRIPKITFHRPRINFHDYPSLDYDFNTALGHGSCRN